MSGSSIIKNNNKNGVFSEAGALGQRAPALTGYSTVITKAVGACSSRYYSRTGKRDRLTRDSDSRCYSPGSIHHQTPLRPLWGTHQVLSHFLCVLRSSDGNILLNLVSDWGGQDKVIYGSIYVTESLDWDLEIIFTGSCKQKCMGAKVNLSLNLLQINSYFGPSVRKRSIFDQIYYVEHIVSL